MAGGRAYLSGVFYHLSVDCAHLPRFLNRIGDRIDHLPFERDAVSIAVRQLKRELETIEGKIDDTTALSLLMAHDLGKAEEALSNDQLAARIDAEVPFEQNLLECREEGVAILQEFDIEIEAPELFIVDELPRPYNKANYSVIATDEDDRQQHGIAPGLYFLRAKLRPFHSKFLLLHELVHTALGLKSPFEFGRGLEEGIAEVLGGMYLSARILGKDLTTNLFKYNRLSFPHKQFWDLYLDYTRQAAYLYMNFGLTGLIDLVKSGRRRIKTVEEQCLSNRLTEIDLSSGNWDEDLTDMVNYLTLTFARDLVSSPLAKYLAPFVRKAKTSVEIFTDANVDMEPGRKALEELQTRVVMAIFREDMAVVSLSEADLLSKDSIIRYELPDE
jgi:hypothetical protein